MKTFRKLNIGDKIYYFSYANCIVTDWIIDNIEQHQNENRWTFCLTDNKGRNFRLTIGTSFVDRDTYFRWTTNKKHIFQTVADINHYIRRQWIFT